MQKVSIRSKNVDKCGQNLCNLLDDNDLQYPILVFYFVQEMWQKQP